MSIPPEMIHQIAQSFFTAEDNHQPIQPVAAFYPDILVEEAYQVQAAVVSGWMERGHRIVGQKAAATSQAAQAKMRIQEPIYGHLFDFQQAAPGSTLSARHFIQPFIECELAFVFKQAVSGPNLTPTDILAATHVVAAFDIVDFRTTEFQVGMPEALCYNVYTRHFVLGRQSADPAGLDLPNLKVTLAQNGAEVASATGAAIMGNPARSITWVANKLAEHGRSLKAGHFVLTGAITHPQPIQSGDQFSATFETLGTLTVSF